MRVRHARVYKGAAGMSHPWVSVHGYMGLTVRMVRYSTHAEAITDATAWATKTGDTLP